MGLDSTPSGHTGGSVNTPAERERYLLQLARRRAAKRDWHLARSRAEDAAKALTEAGDRVLSNVADVRSSLEDARHGERNARSTYQRVARETSAQLSRLGTSATDRPR